jgi:hypothetical protein
MFANQQIHGSPDIAVGTIRVQALGAVFVLSAISLRLPVGLREKSLPARKLRFLHENST